MRLSALLLLCVIAPSASAQMREDQRQAMADYHASFARCVDVYSCEEFLVPPSSRVWLTDPQREHLLEVFSSSGTVGRDMLISALGDGPSYRVSSAINIALEIGGFDTRQINQLLDMAALDDFSGAVILLGAFGTEETFARLLELSEEYRTSTLIHAVSLAGDTAIEPVYQRVLEYLRRGERESAEYLASIVEDVGRDGGRLSGLTITARGLQQETVLRLADRATNPNATYEERIAALLLLGNIGEELQPAESRLVDLARRNEPEIARMAIDALIQIGNTDFVSALVARCETLPLNGDKYFNLWQECPLRYFQSLGHGANAAGPRLLEISYSEHVEFRIEVFLTLAAIGYEPAIPRIRDRLGSQYWSETLAVVSALQDMRADNALPEIEALSSEHWFPYVREQLQATIEDWGSDWSAEMPENRYVFFDIPQATECTSLEWQWQGQRIEPSTRGLASEDPTEGDFGRRYALDIQGGTVIGTDRGEWGGEILAQMGDGEPEVLFEDNVIAMRPYRNGALIATGLNHLITGEGHLFFVWFENGRPQINHITQSAEPSYGGFSQISDNVFAAFGSPVRDDYGSRQFVTVFDVDLGVLGLAECVEN